jgi:hypothetical protein
MNLKFSKEKPLPKLKRETITPKDLRLAAQQAPPEIQAMMYASPYQ